MIFKTSTSLVNTRKKKPNNNNLNDHLNIYEIIDMRLEVEILLPNFVMRKICLLLQQTVSYILT